MQQSVEGWILFDAGLVPQVGQEWFDADYWRGRDALHMQAGGRGGVAVIDTPAGKCVLRHYRRGGLVARMMGDHYFWTGADRTRPFMEFRLLEQIAQLELPGPTPVAARCRRQGLVYTADLITRRIDGARTLAECLAAGRLDAALAGQVGDVIARFHAAGIWHADLNAHNVLVTDQSQYLIDFDRGRQREPAPRWQQSNLMRLRRSLVKLGANRHGESRFEQAIWQPLLQGYRRTMKA